MTLDQIGIKYNTDKNSNYHKYLAYYESKIAHLKNNRLNILEIGILDGKSIRTLEEYFSNSIIYAFDIHDKRMFESERIKIFIGDQSNKEFLNSFEDGFFDLIIDDGSHKMEHQQISLGVLFKKLKSGGIYFLEDLHTSLPDYHETIHYGRNLFGLSDDGSNSTIEFLNGLSKKGPNFYLTKDEYKYLENNIQSIEIKETNTRSINNRSITSCIKKK